MAPPPGGPTQVPWLLHWVSPQVFHQSRTIAFEKPHRREIATQHLRIPPEGKGILTEAENADVGRAGGWEEEEVRENKTSCKTRQARYACNTVLHQKAAVVDCFGLLGKRKTTRQDAFQPTTQKWTPLAKRKKLLWSVPFNQKQSGGGQRSNEAEDAEDHRHVVLSRRRLLTRLALVAGHTLAASDVAFCDAAALTAAVLQITGRRGFFN
ncbi:hypothetical protein EYF80_003371 [Liparis tanakae]|uniref:Uncharacterized protein n=1 Tax=Liparis tanakae TaxID=230148 RepID=A0A4Z2J7W8_9TELE|nr:hypothetical protein EYF80_003371 [Liparis tanakae]